MARVITNDEIYSVLGSIDSSMQKSLTLMKDSLAIDERRAALAKEATERARTSDKLSALEDDGYKAGEQASSGGGRIRSGIASATSGGIFGNGNMLKLGLAAAAAPFALSFLKGMLFGENGLFAQASNYLSTEGISGITSKLGDFLSNELTGTILGTLVFGKKFILFTLAQKAMTKFIEDKFGVDVPDWLEGPAGAAVTMIAASIVGAAAKRALFAVGGAALAGTLKLGKKAGYKAAIMTASALGAKALAEKMAAKEAAEAAADTAAKVAGGKIAGDAAASTAKLNAAMATNVLKARNFDYNPKTMTYTSKSTGKPLVGAARATAEKTRLADEAAKLAAAAAPESKPVIGGAAKVLSKLNPVKPVASLVPDAVGKLALKSLPFAGALLGGIFAAERLYAGDTTSAALNASAAAMDLVPVVGTAGSISADVASALTEVFHGAYGVSYNPKDPEHQAAMVEITKMLEAEMAKTISKNPQLTRAQAGVSDYDIKQQAAEYSLMQQSLTPFITAPSSSLQSMYPNLGSDAAGIQYRAQQMAAESRQKIIEQNAVGGFNVQPVVIKGGDNVSGGNVVNNNSSTTIVNNTYDPAKSLNTTPK
jgi:hypothetical protein